MLDNYGYLAPEAATTAWSRIADILEQHFPDPDDLELRQQTVVDIFTDRVKPDDVTLTL